MLYSGSQKVFVFFIDGKNIQNFERWQKNNHQITKHKHRRRLFRSDVETRFILEPTGEKIQEEFSDILHHSITSHKHRRKNIQSSCKCESKYLKSRLNVIWLWHSDKCWSVSQIYKVTTLCFCSVTFWQKQSCLLDYENIKYWVKIPCWQNTESLKISSACNTYKR